MLAFHADPLRCPDCGQPHGGGPRCVNCGLRLAGHAAVELWQLTQHINSLMERRTLLLSTLRPGTPTLPADPPGAAAAAADAPALGAPVWQPAAPDRQPAAENPLGPRRASYPAVQPPLLLEPPRTAPQWTPPPKPEWTQERVQNTLLGLGALLVAIAALIFTVVTWSKVGAGGRAAILFLVTAATATAAPVIRRRALESTAEAVAAVAAALLLVDAQGARQSFADLQRLDARVYWAGATLVIGALCLAYARAVRLETPRLVAVGALQVASVLIAWRLENAAAASFLLLAQTALSAYAATRIGNPRVTAMLATAAALTGFAGVVLALEASFDSDIDGVTAALPGGLALLAVGATAVWAGWLHREQPRIAQLSAGAATLAAAASLIAACRPALDTEGLTAIAALSAAASVLVALKLPRDWHEGPLVAGPAIAVFALLPLGTDLLAVVTGPFESLLEVWSLTQPQLGVRTALLPATQWESSWQALVTVVAALLTVSLLGVYFRHHLAWQLSCAAMVALTVIVTPYALDWSYAAAIGWELSVVVAVAALAIWAAGHHRTLSDVSALGAAALLLTHTLPSALANEPATHAALAVGFVTAAVTAALTRAHRAPSLALAAASLLGWSFVIARSAGLDLHVSGFVTTAVAAVVLAATAANAHRPRVSINDMAAGELVAIIGYGTAVVTTFESAPWAAAALLAGAAAAAAVATRRDRLPVAGAATALVAAAAWALASARGASIAGSGLAVVAVACAAAGVAWLLADRAGHIIEVAAVAAYLVGGAATAEDKPILTWVLLAGGLTCFAVSLRTDRRPLAYAGWALLTMLLWMRLRESDVTAPEPYLLPPGLVTLGIGYLRRLRLPTMSSWAAYGTGLALVLEPTLFMTLADSGLMRPLLLGAGALVVVLVGARLRLQAPLLLGGATLAAVALIQIAPYAAALPRWVSIAVAGIILLLVGATYEQRLRDVRRLQARVEALG